MGLLAFLYGVISYLLFVATYLYGIGFVGNLVVPKSIDSGPVGPLSHAIAMNVALLGLFAIHHSVTARPGFKRVWTKVVSSSIERSTYVLLSSLLLLLVYWKWQPIAGEVWAIENPVGRVLLEAIFASGWLLALTSTFGIDHFDLFGLRQVYFRLRGRDYEAVAFRKTALYGMVRHPIMLGFLVAFWATPRMSYGHLLFSIVTTAYVVVAIQIEERDLARTLGAEYRRYRDEVPMLLPWPRR